MPRRRKSHSVPAKVVRLLAAAVVLGLVPIGLVMADLDRGLLPDRLQVVQESLGVMVLGLLGLRLGNQLRGPPHPAARLAFWERVASIVVKRALYLVLLLTPLFGWLALSACGLAPAFLGLGGLPTLLVKSEPLSEILLGMHKAGGVLVGALVVLHVAAGMRHALRDNRFAVRPIFGAARRRHARSELGWGQDTPPTGL